MEPNKGQLYQFDIRKKAVTKDNGISFNDFGRMQIKRTGGAKGSKQNPIPRWAKDDVLLRKVIIAYLENTVVNGRYGRRLYPELTDAERLENARRRSKEEIFPMRCQLVGMINRYNKMGADDPRFNNFAEQIQNVDSRIQCLERGLDVIATAVSYMSYRLNYTSVQIAEELKLTPPHVRMILHRLDVMWTKISGGEQRESHYAPGGKWVLRPTKIWPVWKRQLLFVLRASGRTFPECARALKIGANHGDSGASTCREAYVRYFCQAVDNPPGKRAVKMERLPDGGKKIAYRLLVE